MSCRKHGHDDDNCVCGVLRAIADAQDQVDPDTGDCDVSCDRSIQQLLAGTSPTNGNNTIPVILFCECEPFEGLGVRRNPAYPSKLQCFNSILFRVNSVDEDCCASLELLTIGDQSSVGDCASIDGFPIGDINGTGICITVDLSCFCAVTCLDPVSI